MADYYDILGVSASASAADIRKAYARLAKERHPDRFADPVERERAQEFFKDLTAAFNTLSSERNRREYDVERAKPKLTTPEEIAQDAYARALKGLESGDPQAAVDLLRVAVHHAPGEARYHVALGRVLARNPHWVREGIQEVEKAVQLAPQQAAYHAVLAELFHRQGLKLRARKAMDTALHLAPEDREVQRVAGLLGDEAEEARK